MLTEVMQHYRLVSEFRRTDYYETPEQQHLFKQLKEGILAGNLIALTGIVGCGKTKHCAACRNQSRLTDA